MKESDYSEKKEASELVNKKVENLEASDIYDESPVVRKDESLEKRNLELSKIEGNNDNLVNLNNESIFGLAEKVYKGSLCPFTSVEDTALALIAGRELGLGFMASINGIYPINGRASLGVHLKKGILLSNGIIYKKVKDYEPVYNFYKTDKDGKVITREVKNKKGEVKKLPIIIGSGFSDECPDDCTLSMKSIDYATKYVFTRYFKVFDRIVKNNAIGYFSYNEAVKAELIERDVYTKYIKDMISARAFSRGSNEIADDLLNGMLSISEMAGTDPNITVIIDEDGKEIVVENHQQ